MVAIEEPSAVCHGVSLCFFCTVGSAMLRPRVSRWLAGLSQSIAPGRVVQSGTRLGKSVLFCPSLSIHRGRSFFLSCRHSWSCMSLHRLVTLFISAATRCPCPKGVTVMPGNRKDVLHLCVLFVSGSLTMRDAGGCKSCGGQRIRRPVAQGWLGT